ncbi:MAG: DUF3035 domain-containing protein [Proteobacteria bacterium]|nr:DUF3035 domain-containing protein [Pseudomonadota bacterium]
MLKLILPVSLVVLLSACGNDPVFGKNGNFRLKDAGPDEFSVLPTKELVFPEDYATLPEPTLGSRNRAEITPQRDAIAVLGGKPEQLDSKTIGSGEQPLITAASRHGVSPEIRETLAAEDKEYRKKNRARFFDKWFHNDKGYLKRHEGQTLDAYKELSRLRTIGVRTPSVGPDS